MILRHDHEEINLPIHNAICLPIDRPIPFNGISLCLGGLLVCLNVELYEKHKVTRKQAASKQCSTLCARAVGNVWQPVPSAMSKVLIGCERSVSTDSNPKRLLTTEVDNHEVDDELSNLHRRQVLFPLLSKSIMRVSYGFRKSRTQILAPPAVA